MQTLTRVPWSLVIEETERPVCQVVRDQFVVYAEFGASPLAGCDDDAFRFG